MRFALIALTPLALVSQAEAADLTVVVRPPPGQPAKRAPAMVDGQGAVLPVSHSHAC